MSTDPTLLTAAVEALTGSTQVAIQHSAYGSGGGAVAAGFKTGWVGTITATTVQVRSAAGGGGTITATIPKANILAVAGAPGWRNLG